MAEPTTFDGRRPSFNARGDVRGFRSRPGAPQADPTGAARGGTNAMSASAWRDTFKTVSPQTELAALASKLTMPDGTAGAGDGGIAGQTLDAAFGPGYWNRLVGLGPKVPPAPSLYTPKPFMPRGPGDAFTVPKPLTGPLGDKASDRANLGANRALYAPGGATGLWGKRVGTTPQRWQGPANPYLIAEKYGQESGRPMRDTYGNLESLGNLDKWRM